MARIWEWRKSRACGKGTRSSSCRTALSIAKMSGGGKPSVVKQGIEEGEERRGCKSWPVSHEALVRCETNRLRRPADGSNLVGELFLVRQG